MSESRKQDSFLDQPGLLDPLFEPRSLVVIGAAGSRDEGSDEAGQRLLARLRNGGYQGAVHAGLEAAPDEVDLALITAPGAELSAVLERCAERGVRFAISLAQVHTGADILPLLAGLRSPRLLGPNSIGILRPWLGLQATTFPVDVRPGPVGFLTQSGALGAGILDWSLRAQVGFSTFLSLGTTPGVSWGDLIYRLGDDARTRSILIYMESIGEARSFLSAAREVSRSKPIIVLKAGRTAAGSRAASEHTLQAPGDDEVLDAAFRRCGVLRVERISDLFYMSEVLGKQALPRGPRLAIVTNAAGPSVLAVDALVASGGELAERPASANPLGLPPGTAPSGFAQAVAEAAADDSVDGVLAVLTPQTGIAPVEVANALRAHAHHPTKPLLASFLGGREAAGGVSILNDAGIPTVPYPDTAARSFTYMVRYARNLKNLYQTPRDLAQGAGEERHEVVRSIVDAARGEGRTALAEEETERLLAAYGLRQAPATGPAGAAPLRLASRVDAQFGPVLQLGAGGALRPFLPGDALALPPLNSTLSRLTVERSVVNGGLRRGGFSLEALERALLQLSLLVSENRRIAVIELDPVWVSGESVGVGTARIELHGFDTPDTALPRLAIRPYPERYVRSSVLKSGETVVIRPIRAEDEPAMVEFHKGLSERSVYFRYFQILNLTQRTAHERLTRICFIDYAREMALVAERANGDILGVGRLSRLHGSSDAEFAVLVADSSQGQGLGLELLRRLIEVAREEGIAYLAGQIHPENRGMIALARKAGFRIRDLIDEGVVESYLNL